MATVKLLQGKFTKKTDKGIQTFRADVKGQDVFEANAEELKMLGKRVKKISAADVKKLTLTVNPADKEDGLEGDEEKEGDDLDSSDDEKLKD